MKWTLESVYEIESYWPKVVNRMSPMMTLLYRLDIGKTFNWEGYRQYSARMYLIEKKAGRI